MADHHLDPRGIFKCPMKHLDVVDAKLDSTLGARPRLDSIRLGEEASAPTQAARAPWHIPYTYMVQPTVQGTSACARIALRVQ
jgi:hypothetical protein